MLYKSFKYMVLFAVTIGVLFTVASCGKKGMPKPPRYIEPPSVANVVVTNVENNLITLVWTLPPTKDEYNLKTFHVYIAQDALATLCLTCPPNFVITGEGKSITQNDGTREYSFQMPIQQGFRYVYKVRAVGREGQEGSDSNYAVYNYD